MEGNLGGPEVLLVGILPHLCIGNHHSVDEVDTEVAIYDNCNKLIMYFYLSIISIKDLNQRTMTSDGIL